VQTLLTVLMQSIRPRGVRQQSRAIIGLSNVIQAQSDRRGDCPRIRSKLGEASFGVAHAHQALLELDRSIGRNLRSNDAEEANFGFFSEEAPGTGAVVLFSEYDAFALLNGLRTMEHRLATGLRSFNHAPRPSRSRKGARADPSAMSGQAFRIETEIAFLFWPSQLVDGTVTRCSYVMS